MQILLYFLTFILFLFCCLTAPAWAAAPEKINVPQMGPSLFFKAQQRPSLGFIALLSPSTGWDSAASAQAQHLAHEGYHVLGLDMKTYAADRKNAKDECLYPSGLIEEASQDLQKNADSLAFHRPVLIGLGDSGGAAAAIMMQTLPGTYAATLAPAFCPTSKLSIPLCLGTRLSLKKKTYDLLKADEVKSDENMFLAADPACTKKSKNWPVMAQAAGPDFIDAHLKKLVTPFPEDGFAALADLPLTYLPADGNDWLVILISGDGGWRDIDRQIGENLQKMGYAVIGLDSLRYFWHEKTPKETAQTLERVIAEGLKGWHKRRVALLGFSFGADLLPFTVAEMKPATPVAFMGLLGFSRYGLFEITAGSFLGEGDQRYDNLKAFQTMRRQVPTLCLYGQEDAQDPEDNDADSLCLQLHQPWIKSLGLPGGHHFDGDYENLTRQIVKGMEPPS